MDCFFHFYFPNNPKNQNFERMKKTPRDIILHMCTINNNHMMYGSWDMERDRQKFCHFGPLFALLSPKQPKKSKFWINEKTTWRYYHFAYVYHKWQSYDVWLLRYGVCDRQNFLLFWTVFCPFTPLTTRKIKILKKWKQNLEILSFYTCVPQMTIIWCMILEISSTMDKLFCHFGPFFSHFTPLTTQKIKILKEWKKHLGILSFYTSVP